MSITVMERVTSRPLVNDPKAMSVSREYWAHTNNIEEDPGDINDAVANASPNFYLGMMKKRILVNPQGAGFWHATVEYGSIEGIALTGQGIGDPGQPTSSVGPEDKLGPEFSFTTSGGTEHVTQSLGTITEAGYGGRVPPETNNAIGVSKSGVAGCDIIVPKFECSTVRRVAFVTMNYVNRLVDCTGCVNNATWHEFDHHCALFLGAEGHYDGQVADDSWLVTFKFLIGRNQTDILIRAGSLPSLDLRIESKFAHDYLWVGYEPDVDETAGVLLQVPWFAKVERLYKEADFAEKLGF